MTTAHHNQDAEASTKKVSNKVIAIIIAVVVVILATFLGWLYTGSLSAAKQSVFTKLPLPVALIESRHVTSTELFKRVKLAKELLASSRQDTTNVESVILDQLIETKKVDILAARNDVTVNNDDIENAYKGILKQFPTQSETELENELQTAYGLDLLTFKNEVLKQTVVREKLSLWFNSQESLNTETYITARDLLNQLDNGTSFDEIATKYNDDSASQAFAGDSGFVAYNDLLPEFQTAVKDLAINDNRIVPSRYGVHVLRVNAITEGEGGAHEDRSYNIQQIFLSPNDFNTWLLDETSKIKSVKLL